MREAIFRQDTSWLTVADTHVVNNGIKAAQPIQLLGHPMQIRQARGVANNDVSGSG